MSGVRMFPADSVISTPRSRTSWKVSRGSSSSTDTRLARRVDLM